ncbi:hypothetical protein BDW_13140 [Bdellovibrio bacteriovorus W]|nr:hypothetical protein BDW_13140 [Bdellovibrio bacteriovorus W]
MSLKLKVLISLWVPLLAGAQVGTFDSSSTLQSIQLQQQHLMQQQNLQMIQAQQEVAKQAQLEATAQQNQNFFQIFIGFCSQLFGGKASGKTAMGSQGQNLTDTAYEMEDIAIRAREQEGFIYEKDLDREVASSVGGDVSAVMAKGCDNFINKEGKLGPWGSYTLQQIKDKPDSFGANIPDDITKWCPNYPKMNKDQRELYWVWIIMSMASSESSCNPKNDNPNAPNGTAKGLLQVWKPVCPKARDLSNPYQNIQCGVDLLAKELQNRDTLMTPTSKGREGTYWGPLRSDDWNKRRGGDIGGAKKTRAIMSQYRYCK